MKQSAAAIIAKLPSFFENYSKIAAIALVGSGTSKNINTSNLDFLIITEKKLSKKNIINFYKKIKGDTRGLLLRYFQNGFTYKIGNIKINLTFFPETKFTQDLTNIINGKKVELLYKDWTLGAFAPEGFCGDVKEATILLDRHHLIVKWKQKLLKYPQKMKKTILKKSTQEVIIKENLLKKAIKEGNSIAFHISFSQLLFITIRILFALNEKFFQGINYLEDKTKDFSANSKRVFNLINKISRISRPDMKTKIPQIAALIKETKKILKI